MTVIVDHWISSQCMISVIVTIKLTTILDFLLPSITDKLKEMATKRKLIKEFESVSAATLSESANIHGIVANVSPMKPGKCAKFFEVKITDVAKTM